MEDDKVKLCASESHISEVQEICSVLMYSTLYSDTQIICSNGNLSINSMLLCFLYPELESRFIRYPGVQTILLPSHSVQEFKTDLNSVLGYCNQGHQEQKDETVSQGGDESCEFMLMEPELDGNWINSENFEPSSSSDDRLTERLLDQGADLTKGKRGKVRSQIWKYFEPTDSLKESACCKECGKEIKTRKGCTTSMIRHLKTKHQELQDETFSLSPEFAGRYSWALSFISPGLEGDTVGTFCNLCKKFFKTSVTGNSVLQNHLELQHKEIFKTLCFVCKQGLEETEPSSRCSICDCCFHPDCVETSRNDDYDADGWCAYCCRQDRSRQQRTKYYLSRINSCAQTASVCPECGKEFKNLSNHIKVHHLGLNNHKSAHCDICKKVFTQKAHLKEHVKSVHEQIKKFKCTFCDREFFRKPNFKRHMKTMHMNLQINQETECVECGKVFKSKNSLRKHIKIIHQGISSSKKLYCEDCGQCFTQSGSLYTHMRKVHGKEPDIPKNRQNLNIDKIYIDTSVILEAHPELKTDLETVS